MEPKLLKIESKLLNFGLRPLVTRLCDVLGHEEEVVVRLLHDGVVHYTAGGRVRVLAPLHLEEPPVDPERK